MPAIQYRLPVCPALHSKLIMLPVQDAIVIGFVHGRRHSMPLPVTKVAELPYDRFFSSATSSPAMIQNSGVAIPTPLATSKPSVL